MSAVREVEVVVVGGGPAGLSAARRLAELGVHDLLVVEREAEAGGIPRHCWHPGYGMRDLRRVTSGPRYAAQLVSRAREAGVEIATGTMVTGWTGPTSLLTASADGPVEVRARAVLLATGTRERPRSARLVPGDRPSGVWTTGQLQQAVHLHHREVGRRAVVVGAELVSYSAVLTLRDAGCETVAMVTALDRPETYRVAELAARTRFRTPLLTRSRVTRIVGHGALEAVEVTHEDGRVAHISCDAVVFTADWIPDNELARAAGVPLVVGSRAPQVDSAAATARPGVFAAGNLVHPAETADLCALGGRHAAESVATWLRVGGLGGATGGAGVDGSDDAGAGIGSGEVFGEGVPVETRGPIAWVAPQVLRVGRAPVRGRLTLRASEVVPAAELEVNQGDAVLATMRVRGGLLPGRPVHVPTPWLAALDPSAGPVLLTARPR